MADLQARLPMLSARLCDTKTNHPGYVPGSPVPASDIVRDADFIPNAPADEELLEVYRTEMGRFEKLEFDGPNAAPMWAITRATGASDRGYLLVAFNHLLIDGRGSTFMIKAITAHDIDYIAKEDWETPTRYDDTISTKASVRFFVPIIFRELLVPKLPTFMQRPFMSSDPWPGAAMKSSPFEVGWNIALSSLSPDQVSKAKSAGKAHSVATLHPILKMAYVAALWRVFHSEDAMRVQVSTARDERKPSLGHAAITHNYVSSTEWDTSMTGSEEFWDLARGMAHKLSSDEGVQEGRMTMGLLAHLPDPDVDPTSPTFNPDLPTGWEQYFTSRASSATPYRDSVSVSNLGLVTLPPGATDAMWGQTASPFGSAYMVNILGHEGGVRLSSTFRDGSVTDKSKTDDLHRVWMKVVERIVNGESDLTIEEITA